MGFGAMAARTVGLGILGISLWAGGSYVMDKINGNNAAVEQGYVSPKSVSVQGKKNAAGNLETYLNYKSGDDTVSLPVMKGPNGPLVGSVDYWWGSISADSRSGLVQQEWPELNNSVKHDIMSSELQGVLDSFYGTSGTQKQQQYAPQQYTPAAAQRK